MLTSSRCPVGNVLGHLQRFPLNYLMTFACAALSYYVVEKRLIRWDVVWRRLQRQDAGFLSGAFIWRNRSIVRITKREPFAVARV